MRIDGERLLSRLSRLAEIGRTADGGVTRLALSQEDRAARALVVSWAMDRGFDCRRDAAGNIFVTRPGTEPDRYPLMTGSHLDTQRNGGNLDGIYGVLAGLEVLESLEDSASATRSPVKLAIWNNEEGVRFPPVTMGSAIWSGKLDLADLQGHQDRDGISLAEALDVDRTEFARLAKAPFAEPFRHYVELHIEQGPVLERMECPVGLVTGIQGLRQFAVRVKGRAAHAGTTPMTMRQDAFVAAITIYRQLVDLVSAQGDGVYFTVGRFEVAPGTPNTVPAQAEFTIDLRSGDPVRLEVLGQAVLDCSSTRVGSCEVTVVELIHSRAVDFDPAIMTSIETAATAEGLAVTRLPSGATHDALNTAHLGATGMIFVPSRGGISHNPEEWTEPADLVTGCQVLSHTLLDLDKI